MPKTENDPLLALYNKKGFPRSKLHSHDENKLVWTEFKNATSSNYWYTALIESACVSSKVNYIFNDEIVW